MMAVGRRAEQQMRNRGRILDAAREEFAQVGYRDARIDSIAARAELTRGAVYSNFPSKRALGFTVAAGLLTSTSSPTPSAASRDQAVVSLAQAWLARLPLGGQDASSQVERLTSDLYAEISQDRDLRDACAALLQLDAILLAHVLERLDGSADRAVRVASALLTVLHSADNLSASAPGFIDPFTIVSTCTALASADFNDRWTPPHESIVPATRAVDRAWEPPADITDLMTNAPVEWKQDEVVALLGLRQAASIEQALRALPEGHAVALVLVTDDTAERTPMASLVLSELIEALRRSIPRDALTGISLILDHDGAIARTVGVRAATDDTHMALRINDGRIIEESEGPAACHAIGVSQTAMREEHSAVN